MSTYRVPKCGRHFVNFDDVTIYCGPDCLAHHNRSQLEALRNTPHKLCSHSPEPRTEVYCLWPNFNKSKLVYSVYPVCRVQQKLFLRKAIMKPTTIVFNSRRFFVIFNHKNVQRRPKLLGLQ